MLKKKYNLFLYLVAFSSILLSCSHLNELGQRRVNFNIEKIKPNKNNRAFEIIDTSKIYKLVDIKNTFDSSYDFDMNVKNNANPSYLKFYGKGRVGEFTSVYLNRIETLNPKNAKSYLYNLKKDKFIVQIYFKHPQCGECFTKRTLKKTSKDTIVITDNNYIEKYIAIELPKPFLSYKPDW